jgi:hypothetical protein
MKLLILLTVLHLSLTSLSHAREGQVINPQSVEGGRVIVIDIAGI